MTAKCYTCGKFFKFETGVHWKMVYSGSPPEPYGQIFNCIRCGPFYSQDGIKPEYSCGTIDITKNLS